MRAASLFAGIGGFDLGLTRAGIDVELAVEIDPNCRKVLHRHFPQMEILKDVAKTAAGHLDPVDLLCGGFPCTDLSVAGRRAGLDGSRSGLWWEFERLIATTHPRWVVIENVPGLLSSNGGRDMGAVLGSLGDMGYGWAYRVLDAQWFGLAQRRRRVFIVGCAGAVGSAAACEVLLDPYGGAGDSRPRRGTQGHVAGETQEGADGPGAVAVSVNQRAEGRTGELHGSLNANHRRSSTQFDAVIDGSVLRRLTPLEHERLQGFPDGWTAGYSDTVRYRMLGNAVAVPIVEWLGRRIMEVPF